MVSNEDDCGKVGLKSFLAEVGRCESRDLI